MNVEYIAEKPPVKPPLVIELEMSLEAAADLYHMLRVSDFSEKHAVGYCLQHALYKYVMNV